MFENDYAAKQQAYGEVQAINSRRQDVTVRENLDAQITAVEKQLAELHETKARLEKSGILDTRIDDLQRGMRW